PRVLQHGAGQKARFDEHLKTIADAPHQASVRGEALHGGHDGGEASDRPGAEMIAVGEAARQDHTVVRREVSVFVPDEIGRLTENHGERVDGVVLAVTTREDDYPKAHPASRVARRLDSTNRLSRAPSWNG